jgi:hypothetical protein
MLELQSMRISKKTEFVHSHLLPICTWVLREVGAKMEFHMQQTYWGKRVRRLKGKE